jgi:hypothetical protein
MVEMEVIMVGLGLLKVIIMRVIGLLLLPNSFVKKFFIWNPTVSNEGAELKAELKGNKKEGVKIEDEET